jgi:hypothetical protein
VARVGGWTRARRAEVWSSPSRRICAWRKVDSPVALDVESSSMTVGPRASAGDLADFAPSCTKHRRASARGESAGGTQSGDRFIHAQHDPPWGMGSRPVGQRDRDDLAAQIGDIGETGDFVDG